MPFEPFESSKTLSKATQKIYKSALNRLALMDIDTKQKLLDEQKFVVEVLEAIFDDDSDAQRHERRVYLSAIFWVLNDEPLKKKKHYYDFYQKSLPKSFKTEEGDEAWLTKKKFDKKTKE